MKKVINSRLLLVLSMTVFGTVGMFVRGIELPSGEIALYRAVIATLMLSVYLPWRGEKINLRGLKRELWLLLLSGAALGINWMLLFEAYKRTTVSLATLCYYFAPVIVMALSPMIFGEKLTRKQIICFVMSTLGLVMITGIGGSGDDFIGILFGLGAAVFYAAVVLLNKFIKRVEAVQRTLLQFIAATTILVPYVLMTGGVNIGRLDGGGWLNLLIVGILHTGVAYCMYFASIKDLAGQKAAILSYIDPLVAVLISVSVLGERMSFWQAIGGVMILGFTLLNEITFKRSCHDQEGL